jgi:hypothetical protein
LQREEAPLLSGALSATQAGQGYQRGTKPFAQMVCLTHHLRFQTMSDETPKIPSGEIPETRSVNDVLQGAQAVGLGTGGVGTLLIGIAKVREAFGDGAGEPPPQADPPPTPDAPK